MSDFTKGIEDQDHRRNQMERKARQIRNLLRRPNGRMSTYIVKKVLSLNDEECVK